MKAPEKKEKQWLFKVDTIEARERCIKRFVQIARKNAKFLLSPKAIVPFTAETVIQKEKIAAAKRSHYLDAVSFSQPIEMRALALCLLCEGRRYWPKT
ncbi:MAG TPA: hypothetical protein PL155_02055 [Candidatus Omnitrophota bacterium]|nr:hypothetical protein [Candidatus Omnitrophota bacterium]